MRLNHVPASAGIEWVKQGVLTFARQPLAMSGLFFMFMAALSLLSIIPFLGSLVAVLITPAITVGLMAATRDASHGKFPMPSTLITAFRQGPMPTRAMLILGGLYVLSLLAMVSVAMLLSPDLPDGAAETGLTPEMVNTILSSPSLWLSMLIYIPILMMFWHAPALVHWHGISPVKSLFFSLLACWTNKGAMTVYMAAWFCLMVVSVFVIILISGLFGGASLGVLVYPIALLFASVFYASLFFTFRDSFANDTPPEIIEEN